MDCRSKQKALKVLDLIDKKCCIRNLIDECKSWTSMYVVLNILDELAIRYSISESKKKINSTVILKSNYRDSLVKLEDYDNSKIAKKYDFNCLLSVMKNKMLDKTEICEILKCTRKEYRNIITHMSYVFPIYEENDLIGAL